MFSSKRLLFLCVFALALPIHAQSFSPGGDWTIVDANGKIVGQYLGHNQVSVLLNGIPASMFVDRGSLVGTSDLYYDQPNCQGPAFMDLNSAGGGAELGAPTATLQDGTVMLADPHSATTMKTSASRRNLNGCQSPYAMPVALAAPAQQGPNVAQLFMAPYFVAQSGSSVPMLSKSVLALLTIVMSALAFIAMRQR